jgi:hypothetical protein
VLTLTLQWPQDAGVAKPVKLSTANAKLLTHWLQ